MKSLIRLALLLVVGILVYNYFLGSESEKETSKKIFGEVRDLGKATWDLLKSEKEKFDEGKYDEAVDKVGSLIDRLRGHAETLEDNKDIIARINELDQERKDLSNKINEPESFDKASEKQRQEQIKRESKDLMREIETLMKDMERQ